MDNERGHSAMTRYMLLAALATAAITGLGLSLVLGTVGAAYVAKGIMAIMESNDGFRSTRG